MKRITAVAAATAAIVPLNFMMMVALQEAEVLACRCCFCRWLVVLVVVLALVASKGSKEGFSKINGSYVRVRCEVPVFWNCVPQPTSLLFLPLDKTSTQNIPESNRSIRQSADRIPTFVAPTTFTVDLSL
jgi:hypothetical protein